MSHRIFTNNPLLAGYFNGQPEMAAHELIFMSTPASELLTAVRTAIREGGVLASNPLSGVRMSQNRVEKPTGHKKGGFADKTLPFGGRPVAFNPYVSVLVTPSLGAVDFQSVKRIDEALAVYKKNAGLRFSGRSDESVKQYQMTDMDAMVVALAEITMQIPEDNCQELDDDSSEDS